MTQQTSHPVHGLMAMRGLSFQELGPLVGYHPVYLSEVVRGRQRASARLKDAVAAVFELPAEVLFLEDEVTSV